jgi:hypothetical protein
MMFQRLKAKFKVQELPVRSLLSDEKAAELKAVIAAPPAPPRKPRGKVVKGTKRPEFDPRPGRRGGRVVKAMPRPLQKIKEAQEKVEDDTEV